MTLLRKLCAAALVLALLAVAPATASSVSVVANADTAVYSAASTAARSVNISKGLAMTLTDSRDGWGRVTRGGRTAYIPLKYLNLKSPVKAWLSEEADVYSTSGAKLGAAPAGTAVYVLGFDGDLARVTDAGRSRVGCVKRRALTTAQPTAEKTDKRVETAIRTAQALMGRPYALNANPPESFNCAALVYYCFNRAQNGSIRSSLVGQVHDDRHRKITSAADLKRGDLVCFNFDDESDNYGHVGIYLGGGSFIHASNLDDQVTVSTMASGYYQRAFSWGRRIFG